MSKTLEKKFQTIIRHLIGSDGNEESLTRIDVSGQFLQEEKTDQAIVRNLNAAFLIALSGRNHPRFEEANGYLKLLQNHTSWGEISRFYQTGLDLIGTELAVACSGDERLKGNLGQLYAWLTDAANLSNRMETHRD